MGATQSPWLYSQTGHPFDRLPLNLVQQLGNDGVGGIQYYFNHFFEYTGPLAAGTSGGWIMTDNAAVGAGAGAIAVQDSARYGVLRITSDAADNDNTSLQMQGGGWRYSAGQRLWFFTRLALQTAIDGPYAWGLVIDSDLTIVGGVSDGIYIQVDEGDDDLDFHAIKNSAGDDAVANYAAATLTDATMFTTGFVAGVAGELTPYYSADSSTFTAGTAIASGDAGIPDDEDLTIHFEVQTGSATTRYMEIDWVLVAAEHA